MARQEETIGTVELAEELGVHRNTIGNWMKQKVIRPDEWTLGGRQARWKRSTVRALKKKFRTGSRAAA